MVRTQAELEELFLSLLGRVEPRALALVTVALAEQSRSLPEQEGLPPVELPVLEGVSK